MIYYKNVLLSISNGLNAKRVSAVPNPYADKDAQVLASACLSDDPIVAGNYNQYYYFYDYSLDTDIIQYLLNRNGVLAYRHYSKYQVFYGNRRFIVRVPVDYLNSHPVAKAFMQKIIKSESNLRFLSAAEETEYINRLKEQMRQR